MNITKLIATAILSIALSIPLMAGSKTSEALLASTKKEVKAITPQTLKKMIDNEDDLWMLDIRESYMVIEGSIEGMDNVAIGRGVLEFNVEHAIEDKKALVIVYCRSGKGAILGAEMLQNVMGYKNVRYLEGGIEAWLEAGYTIFNNFGELQLAQ
jgi:rhodanese-related sulfurtransferase